MQSGIKDTGDVPLMPRAWISSLSSLSSLSRLSFLSLSLSLSLARVRASLASLTSLAMSDLPLRDILTPSALAHLHIGSRLGSSVNAPPPPPPPQVSAEGLYGLTEAFAACWADTRDRHGEADIRAQYVGLMRLFVQEIGFSDPRVHLRCLADFDLDAMDIVGRNFADSFVHTEMMVWKRQQRVLCQTCTR